jgi:hypothetical protein
VSFVTQPKSGATIRVPHVVIAALVAFFSFGCSGPAAPDPAGPVAITRLGPTGRALTTYSGYSQPQRFVVKDSATMALVWETIYRNVSSRPDMPLVDFTHYMVLVVALGTRPTTGWDILLDSAVAGSNGLVVYDRIGSPTGGAVLQVITAPVDVGVVPRMIGPVEFVDRF